MVLKIFYYNDANFKIQIWILMLWPTKGLQVNKLLNTLPVSLWQHEKLCLLGTSAANVFSIYVCLWASILNLRCFLVDVGFCFYRVLFKHILLSFFFKPTVTGKEGLETFMCNELFAAFFCFAHGTAADENHGLDLNWEDTC